MPLDTTIPSTRALQRLISQGQALQVKVTTGDVFQGKLLWQDQECICLVIEAEQTIILWRNAIAFVQPIK